MKCPSTADWDLLAMEALQGEQAQDLLEHAHACPACRERYQAARRNHVERVRKSRAAIQEKIRRASAEREAYLRAERAKRGSDKTSLDQAVRQAIHNQASERGFTFDDDAAEPAAAAGTGPRAESKESP